jgi:hypothetical protein
MAENRRGISPWSVEREAGIESATVDSNITVPQIMQPTLDSGFIDEKGEWKGRKSSDQVFIALGKEEGIANGGHILAPSVNADGTWPLDMTGYSSLFYAIKPSRAGNYAVDAVMGPDSVSFANLSPVDAAAVLKFCDNSEGSSGGDLESVFTDAAESLIVNVWSIFQIQGRVANQKLLQFKITNNSGGSSDIETAFMRLV